MDPRVTVYVSPPGGPPVLLAVQLSKIDVAVALAVVNVEMVGFVYVVFDTAGVCPDGFPAESMALTV